MAFYRTLLFPTNRIATFGRQFPSAAARDQHIYFELLGELSARLSRPRSGDDEQLTARLVAHRHTDSGSGSSASASSAAILGVGRCPLLRPARVFAILMNFSCVGEFAVWAISENSGASCVQATTQASS